MKTCFCKPDQVWLSRWFLLWFLLFLPHAGCAQQPFSVRDSYAKTEITIPMRDGVKLYTVIFTPKDTSRAYPILMERTPYGVPYGPNNFPGSLGPSPRFTTDGYIFVYQDVRGRFMSEGEFVNVRPQLAAKHGPKDIDESTDAYDTIDWLVKNVPGNNGRVGMWGVSYPGFYAIAGAIHAHPALKAVSPQAPIADWFLGDDDHHNGAFYLMDNFAWDFESSFDWPRPAPTPRQPPTGLVFDSNDAYQFYLKLGSLKNANTRYFHDRVPFWNELMEHGTYDAYWQARNLLPHLRGITPALLTVGGWFDAEDFYGPLHTYETIARDSPATPNYLVLGPWPHGGWEDNGSSFGGVSFGSDTAAFYRDKIEYPFFTHYLKDPKDAGAWKQPKAQVFETGSNRWLAFDAWPPPNLRARSLYFSPSHRLTSVPPQLKAPDTGVEAADNYISDPAHPVPYIGISSIERINTYMIADQRFAAKRADVLTYQTEPLAQELTVLGPITAELFVSTTGTDADWIVKVIDVLPPETNSGNTTGRQNRNPEEAGGVQQLVRADVMRGKFRNSFEKPEPFLPGKVTKVKYALPDICHTFRKGHRLMVQVQSSWFPLVDRNPQTFGDIYQANEADFKAATNRLYHTAEYPSRILFQTQ